MMRKSSQCIQSRLDFASDACDGIQLANLFGPVRWIVSSQAAGDSANSIKDALVSDSDVVPGCGDIILIVSGE